MRVASKFIFIITICMSCILLLGDRQAPTFIVTVTYDPLCLETTLFSALNSSFTKRMNQRRPGSYTRLTGFEVCVDF